MMPEKPVALHVAHPSSGMMTTGTPVQVLAGFYELLKVLGPSPERPLRLWCLIKHGGREVVISAMADWGLRDMAELGVRWDHRTEQGPRR